MEALEKHLVRQLDRSESFFWHRLRWAAVKAELPRDREFNLIDVGAGAGLLGTYLGAEYPKARYGFVEPLPSLNAALRSRYGMERDHGASADYSDADFITLLDVLEHQENDRSFLADLAAKMKPGSTLILTVPALRMLWSRWDVALGHFRRYDKATLTQAFADTSLRLSSISYIMPEMIPLGLARKWRGGSNQSASQDPGNAEFPDLPDWVNAVLYGMGRVSLLFKELYPAGTSLIAVARKE